MPASANGNTLEVRSGTQRVSISDIVIGDVWLANGQSNMEGRFSPTFYEGYERGRKAISKLDLPLLRFCIVCANFSGIPQEDLNPVLFHQRTGEPFDPKRGIKNEWIRCTSDSAVNCSAVALFFGQRIHLETGVPIGIISTAQGGSKISLHMPLELWKNSSDYNPKKEAQFEGVLDLKSSGPTRNGASALPHCLHAARAMRSQRCSLSRLREGVILDTDRSESKKPICDTPSSVAFWTIMSALRPFGVATKRAIRGPVPCGASALSSSAT